MSDDVWRIEMFGGLKAERGDVVLTHFETRKVGALLGCLALGLPRSYSRELLAEQLWPDEDWEAIRNRLRNALSSLRRELEPAGTPPASVIVADRSDVRLNPGAVVTDVAEFEASLTAAAASTEPGAQATELGRAIGLYRGELLSGYMEEWIVSARTRLEEAYGDALVRYARAVAETGDLQTAIDAARRALATDPLREDVHCDLMRFYARDGRTSDIIRQYRGLERLLRDELGVAPSPSTCGHFERLKDELARGEPAHAVPRSLVPDARTGSRLEPDGGAVPLDSRFYIVRPTDHEFLTAVQDHDSIVLVRGPRQVGKTSLLARSLQHAREAGARVVLTDMQRAAPEQLESPAALFRAFGEMMADQLDLDVSFDDVADGRRGWNVNFERFMRRDVLRSDDGHVVWALDEVDRLFSSSFSGVVFGLFRSWHNDRALNPGGPWCRLTLAMAYATEAHLFISDLNQSPFNVGTRLALEDFTRGEVADLNRRYGSPIADGPGIERLYTLVGGCPYLVRRGLHLMAEKGIDAAALEAKAAQEDGPFGDHLRRMWAALVQAPELCDEVTSILKGRGCSEEASFYRLRSAGVITGQCPTEAAPRCGVYREYLGRKLDVPGALG